MSNSDQQNRQTKRNHLTGILRDKQTTKAQTDRQINPKQLNAVTVDNNYTGT